MAVLPFFSNLCSVRCSKNLSVSQLSNLTGISQLTIEQIENNSFIPSVRTALILCAALECSVEDLFFLNESEV